MKSIILMNTALAVLAILLHYKSYLKQIAFGPPLIRHPIKLRTPSENYPVDQDGTS